MYQYTLYQCTFGINYLLTYLLTQVSVMASCAVYGLSSIALQLHIVDHIALRILILIILVVII